MWRTLAPLAALILLAGCDSGVPGSANAGPTHQELPDATSFKPYSTTESPVVALYRESSAVKVGDSWEKAKSVFPEPARDAYEIHDLPPNFTSEYEAHGWETGHGEGFGVILYKDHDEAEGKVVAAMYQLEGTQPDTLKEFLDQQTEGVKQDATIKPLQTVLIGKKVSYWFWQDSTNDQTLMVCSSQDGARINITLAMGDDVVLKNLGVSVQKARDLINRGSAGATQPTTALMRERFAFSQR